MTNEELNKIPEKTVVLKGESLQTLRHMPVPPNLTAAIRGPKDPFHLYEILKEEYPPDHPLKLVLGDSERAIHLSDLNTEEDLFTDVHFLVIPPLPDGSAFETFQNTVARLRGPNGCPWDRKQTHQSLRDDLLQEVYELLDGLDRSNMAAVTEELGDVLLHILLQAQIGVDNGEFTMAEVLTHVNDKIISRHAHVFGNPENMSPDQVMVRWEQIKQKEREKQHKTGGKNVCQSTNWKSGKSLKSQAQPASGWSSKKHQKTALRPVGKDEVTSSTLVSSSTKTP